MIDKKVGLVVALVLTVLAGPAAVGAESPGSALPNTASTRKLPRLVDLGANKCIPCKAMAPILEELRTEYAGRMEVQFIDVWRSPEAAAPYGVRTIPTQIFFGPDGRELARHVGFMPKSEILAQWKALGVSL